MNIQLILAAASIIVAIASTVISSVTLRASKRIHGQHTGGNAVPNSPGMRGTEAQFNKWGGQSLTAVITIAALLVGVVAVFLASRQLLTASPPEPSSATVTVTEPPNGLIVYDSAFVVIGEVSGLPQGTVLWLVTKRNDISATFQPLEGPCDTAGMERQSTSFTCGPVFVGSPEDRGPYTLYVVVADAAATSEFLRYQSSNPGARGFPGLAQFPPTAKVAASVEVVRTK